MHVQRQLAGAAKRPCVCILLSLADFILVMARTSSIDEVWLQL